MGDLTGNNTVAPQWLELLAPLPEDASPVQRPVLSDELKAAHSQSEVAGWISLTLHLSAPPIGLRVLVATFDARGRLISASDLVHRRAGGRLEQHSIGGRFKSDGSFAGTHWEGTATDSGSEDEETADWDLKPSEPTADQVSRLRALVDQLKRQTTKQP
jgi:hypothetical protein